MSDDPKKTAARLEHVEKLVEAVHQCIIGDKLHGKPGLVDIVDLHRKEIYGDEGSFHEGLKPKVERMDTKHKEMKWFIGGVCSVASLVILIVTNWSTIISWFK